MNETAIQFVIAVSIFSCITSIFSFCICFYVAQTLGDRLKKENLIGRIIARYSEIREHISRCKISIARIPSVITYQLLGSLPHDLDRLNSDLQGVFLEAFKRADSNKLKEVDAGLNALQKSLHYIISQIEIRLTRAHSADYHNNSNLPTTESYN